MGRPPHIHSQAECGLARRRRALHAVWCVVIVPLLHTRSGPTARPRPCGWLSRNTTATGPAATAMGLPRVPGPSSARNMLSGNPTEATQYGHAMPQTSECRSPAGHVRDTPDRRIGISIETIAIESTTAQNICSGVRDVLSRHGASTRASAATPVRSGCGQRREPSSSVFTAWSGYEPFLVPQTCLTHRGGGVRNCRTRNSVPWEC
jgi:hypothetical protein